LNKPAGADEAEGNQDVNLCSFFKAFGLLECLGDIEKRD
jgi:hypothetical protein